MELFSMARKIDKPSIHARSWRKLEPHQVGFSLEIVAMSSSFVESSPKSLLRSLSSDSENKGLNETITDSNPDIGQVSHNDVDTNAVAVDHEEVEEVMSVDNSRNTPKESNGTFSHVLCCFCLK
ncbi:hypothetical protein F8388_021070 [Cannabis sativa]|uniref:Uncharacterized protein n=1 Tax=Cannabis sativa TaxID=3483 RepID=A0A7J6H0U0_CANSA|nr:hypothetical protein G4B88_015965 [Cannabis sativa]KAF4388240.1 hypothetical protein F8388_021070 [Cannabis sativa]